jgi:hypothetical protein
MNSIILITGASSGFGALTARALAHASHTVYASMRETAGHNAPQVKEAEKYAAEHDIDLRPQPGVCDCLRLLRLHLTDEQLTRTGVNGGSGDEEASRPDCFERRELILARTFSKPLIEANLTNFLRKLLPRTGPALTWQVEPRA